MTVWEAPSVRGNARAGQLLSACRRDAGAPQQHLANR